MRHFFNVIKMLMGGVFCSLSVFSQNAMAPTQGPRVVDLYNTFNTSKLATAYNCSGNCDTTGGIQLPEVIGQTPITYYNTVKLGSAFDCNELGVKILQLSTPVRVVAPEPFLSPQFTVYYLIEIIKDGIPLPNSPLVIPNQSFTDDIIPIGNLAKGNYLIRIYFCSIYPNQNLNTCKIANPQTAASLGMIEFEVLENSDIQNSISLIPVVPDQVIPCNKICFKLTEVEGYISREIDFGDGNIDEYSNSDEVCNTYAQDGFYTATVKYTYGSCSDGSLIETTTNLNFFVGKPDAEIDASSTLVCSTGNTVVKLMVNLTPNNIPLNYSWSNGTIGTPSIFVSPTTTTTYRVTIFQNNSFCNVTKSVTIEVDNNCCQGTSEMGNCGSAKNLTYGEVKMSQIFSDLCLSGNVLDFSNLSATPALSINRKLIVDGNYILKQMAGGSGKVLLGANAKIIIPPGKSLIADKVTFEPCSPSNMWMGIEVHGSGTQNTARQDEALSGKLVLTNCNILEARNAISTSEKYSDGSYSITSTGGIVQCTNTLFFDCGRAAEFLSFHNVDANGLNELPNKSFFRNCFFQVTDKRGSSNINHVTIWDVNGVLFAGCSFEDSRSASLPADKRANGIYTIGASFTVERANNAVGSPGFSVKSKFTGLQNGIRSYAPTSNPAKFSIYVRDAEFDCWKNIYLNGSDFARIHSNKFLVKGSGIKPGYGVHLEQCTGYTIENNDFLDGSAPGTPQNKIAAGVVVRNMHGNPTDVYRNRFNGLLASAIGVGDNNRSGDITVGHQFLCNDLTNTTYDFYVTRDLNLPNNNPGIARNQGLPNGNTAQLAGNLFGGSTRHFQNNDDVNFVDYWHHDPASNPRVAPDPNKVSNNFKAHPIPRGFSINQSCPNRFVKGYDIRVIDLKNLAAFFSKKALLQALVDGGNTTELKNEIAGTTNPEAFQKYSELMSNAGLISETVAKEVIEKEDVFSNAMVRDILVANPHVVKHKELNNWLDARANPLPLYMRLQIDLSTETISQKELLEAEAAGYYKSASNNITAALTDFMDEDAVYNPDSAIAWLGSLQALSDDMKRALILYAEGSEEEAFAIVEAAENKFADEKPTAKEDMQKYMELHELMRKFTPNSKHPAFLDSVDIENLKPLAYSDELYSPLAKGLLALNNALDYEEPVPLPGMESFKKESATNDEKRRLLEELLGNSLQIYPNPAANFTTIEFANAGKEKTTLKITDLQGKTVWKQQSKWNQNEVIVPLKDLQNGVYIISVMNGNKTIASKNLIVQK